MSALEAERRRTRVYLAASAVVLLLVSGHAVNRYWVGDFWAHAAVVRELMRRPLHPMHPLLAVDAPHPLFTPDAWTEAAVARVTGLHPTYVLAAAGVLNVVLLLAGIAVAARTLTRRRSELFVLLAMLLVWGRQPWQFSGFVHLSALGFVAPYPSTFALGLSLTVTGWLARAPLSWRRYAALTLAIAVVLVTHAGAALFIYVGVAAFALDAIAARRLGAAGQLLLLVPLSILLAAGWPLYPFVRFTLYEAAAFAPFNVPMYQQVLVRLGPVLLGLPVIALRLRRNWTDPLAVWFCGCAAIYLLGWVTGNWGLGRILSFAAVLLQMAIGGAIAEAVDARWPIWRPQTRVIAGVCAAGLVLLGTANLGSGIVRALPAALLPRALASDPRLIRPIDVYGVLDGAVEPEAIVLTRSDAGYVVAAQGVKLAAPEHHQAFITDQDERRAAVDAFLGCDASAADRQAILERYDVSYVLLDKRQDPPCVVSDGPPDRFGAIVLETDRLRLIKASRTR